MIQEDEKILVRDLSSRLPYGVRGTVPVEVASGHYDVYDGSMLYDEKEILVELVGIGDGGEIEVLILEDGWKDYDLSDYDFTLDDFTPYLRPMSSMTEEEKGEINDIIIEFGNRWFDAEDADGHWSATFWESSEIVDYLNAHHFDYRGLIEKGLAIEVTEENNPYDN